MALQKCGERPKGKVYLTLLRLNERKIPNLWQQEYGINLRDYQRVDLFEFGGFQSSVKSINSRFRDTNSQVEVSDTGITQQVHSLLEQRLPQSKSQPEGSDMLSHLNRVVLSVMVLSLI